MSLAAGVELTDTQVRVVLRDALRGTLRSSTELGWDPRHPHRTVDALKAQFPKPTYIGLAIGPAFLRTALVSLPPASADARRAMLAIEPDRYFLGATADTTVALAAADEVRARAAADRAPRPELAFALDTIQVDLWIEAFEQWAPVSGVEASLVSQWRMLTSDQRSGRTIAECASSALPVSWSGLPTHFLAAAGAAEAIDAPNALQLLPDAQRQRRTSRRRWRVGASIIAIAAALLAVFVGVDRYRARTLEAVTTALARQQAMATAVQEDVARLTQRVREREALSVIASRRLDPMAVMHALGAALPRNAFVLRLRATDGEWQVDGSAANAADVIRRLEQDARFTDVRVLAATTRFMDQGRSRESFSVGFHAAP